MYFNTLEKLSVAELADLFNRAFADYVVKVQFTPEFLEEKISTEDICLDKSVGAFSDGIPVGFIFHGIRETAGGKLGYNAGTGVVPGFRGQQATVSMYRHILPVLRNDGVTKIVLEVIEKNMPAIRSYEKVGFEKVTDLVCFKGRVTTWIRNTEIVVKKIAFADVAGKSAFRDWEPTWQNSSATMLKSDSYQTFGAFSGSALAGYITVNPQTGRVSQLAVHPEKRKTGIASTLCSRFSEACDEGLMFINIDERAAGTIAFLESIGLERFLVQHKMEIDLKNMIP